MTINFNIDGVIIQYKLCTDCNIYMSYEQTETSRLSRVANSYIFDLVFYGEYDRCLSTQPLIHYWAQSIIGYEIVHGDWPATKTIEDCMKLCVELQRILAMSQSDRDDYVTKLKHNHLISKTLKEF